MLSSLRASVAELGCLGPVFVFGNSGAKGPQHQLATRLTVTCAPNENPTWYSLRTNGSWLTENLTCGSSPQLNPRRQPHTLFTLPLATRRFVFACRRLGYIAAHAT